MKLLFHQPSNLLCLLFWILPLAGMAQATPATDGDPVPELHAAPSRAARMPARPADSVRRLLASQCDRKAPVFIFAPSLNHDLYLFNPFAYSGKLDVLLYSKEGQLLARQQLKLANDLLELKMHPHYRGEYFVQVSAPGFVVAKKIRKRG
ncbi:hypothetical protein [Flaviaesturariibacter amylovorans]